MQALAGEEDLKRPSSQCTSSLNVIHSATHRWLPHDSTKWPLWHSALLQDRLHATQGRGQDFLRDVKSVFDDRPAVYEEIVKNLNSLWKVADTDGCFARVEALLATAPRADLLAQFRDFMPAPPSRPGSRARRRRPIPGRARARRRSPSPSRATTRRRAAPPRPRGDDSDDDVVLVSTTLTNPLVDLPHARHECAALGMPARDDADGLMLARRFCARCYCTLCDRPVSDCAAWPEHSRYRDEPPWRAVRDALTAVPEPPPRRFKRPRLRGAPAAAPRRAQARPTALRVPAAATAAYRGRARANAARGPALSTRRPPRNRAPAAARERQRRRRDNRSLP